MAQAMTENMELMTKSKGNNMPIDEGKNNSPAFKYDIGLFYDNLEYLLDDAGIAPEILDDFGGLEKGTYRALLQKRPMNELPVELVHIAGRYFGNTADQLLELDIKETDDLIIMMGSVMEKLIKDTRDGVITWEKSIIAEVIRYDVEIDVSRMSGIPGLEKLRYAVQEDKNGASFIIRKDGTEATFVTLDGKREPIGIAEIFSRLVEAIHEQYPF